MTKKIVPYTYKPEHLTIALDFTERGYLFMPEQFNKYGTPGLECAKVIMLAYFDACEEIRCLKESCDCSHNKGGK